MKSFRQYLEERNIDLTTSLDIFGVDQIPDENELKKIYKKLSLKHHPDKGGSVQMMQDINLAYEFLKKSGNSRSGKVDWDAINKQYQEMAIIVRDDLLKRFDKDIFQKHFRSIFGKEFNISVKGNPAKNTFKKYDVPYYAGIKVTISSDNKDTVFEMDVSVTLSDLRRSNSLGAKDTGSSMFVSAYGFHNNRKQKMSQKNYKFTNSLNIFTNPELVFPSSKLKKIATDTSKPKKFAKRDAELFLKTKLNAKPHSKEFWSIPLFDDYTFLIYRHVFMRTPVWGPNGIYLKHRRVSMVKPFTMKETEEHFIEFEKVIKKARTIKDEEKVGQFLDKFSDTIRKL